MNCKYQVNKVKTVSESFSINPGNVKKAIQ